MNLLQEADLTGIDIPKKLTKNRIKMSERDMMLAAQKALEAAESEIIEFARDALTECNTV